MHGLFALYHLAYDANYRHIQPTDNALHMSVVAEHCHLA